MIKGYVKGYKFLIGQLNSNGDCILATTVARQIKTDYPGCKLTWAIGSRFKSVLLNNPYVDYIWEIPISNASPENIEQAWKNFEKLALEKKNNGEFDEIFLTQYSYGHFINPMGITRASIFAGYPGKITVPVAPIVILDHEEETKVSNFIEKNALVDFEKVILFECAAFSGQSFIDKHFVQTFSAKFSERYPRAVLILSAQDIEVNLPNVISASEISYRENLALFDSLDLFIGCSSGITWLSTAEGVKKIPKIILLNGNCPQASLKLDHRYFDIADDCSLELTQCTPDELIEYIAKFQNNTLFQATHKSPFDFELTCFLHPFEFYYGQKRFKKAFSVFMLANVKGKTMIVKFLSKNNSVLLSVRRLARKYILRKHG